MFFVKRLVQNYPEGVSGDPDLIQFMKKVVSEKFSVVFE
jgi:hypothetical protein